MPDARGSRGPSGGVRAGARRRRTARPPRETLADAGDRARQRPRAAEQPLDDQLAGDREDQQRRDQVGAAALVLLGGVGGVEAAALIGADRLVLDAVVGGQVAVAKRGRRGQQAEQRRSRPHAGRAAADRRRARAGGSPRSPRRWPAPTASTRGSSIGSRAAGRRRRATGRPRTPRRAAADREAAASSPAAPARRPAWGRRTPRSGRRGCARPPPRRWGRGSAGRCEAPSRRGEAAARARRRCRGADACGRRRRRCRSAHPSTAWTMSR